MTQNLEYDKEISRLKSEIRLNRDSMEYYRSRRIGIEKGKADLEYMAREQFRMQRPTEDVYIIGEEAE